jgi:hypothetical protein
MIENADEFVHLRESDDPDLYLRATNDSASVEVWLDVIAKYPDMASWVAHNKTIPVEIMDLLAKSDDVRVRWTIAAKRRCPPALLEVLAGDRDPTVRLRVACNAKVPLPILQRLLQDPWERVVEVAQERLRERGGKGK